MRITELTSMTAKRRYLDFLLATDPSEDLIMRYLPRGRMFLLEQDDPLQGAKDPEREALGVAVAVDLGTGKCELKNLYVPPYARGMGCGRTLVEHVADVFSDECFEMQVGTGEAMRSFFERCGFAYSHQSPGYYTDNYPHPVEVGGSLWTNRVYLRRMLRPSPLLSLYCMHLSRLSR